MIYAISQLDLELMMQKKNIELRDVGLDMNVAKTKLLTVFTSERPLRIQIGDSRSS